MAFFLHRSRTTTHLLFQNIRSLHPLIPHPYPKSLHTPPPPSKHPNPIVTPLPLFPRRNSKPINPLFLQQDPSIPTIHNPQRFSSTSPQNPQPEHLHQNITGPTTVEPDITPLANETREALESLRRSVYDLSSAFAVLGIAHLGLGAWIAYAVRPPNEVSVQGFAAFAFPFSLAFLLRRTVEPITFLQKVEHKGRLRILTLALQVSMRLRVLFVRMRVVCVCCAVGVSAGSVVATLWMR